MKREDIYDAMNWIDDEFVVNAETIKKRGGISMKRKKTIAICAAVVILAVFGVSVYAGASGAWMKDIKNLSGAITGQVYNDADAEIKLSIISADADGFTVEAVVAEPDKPPYIVIDFLKLDKFTVTDENGKIIAENNASESGEFVNGCASIYVPADISDADTIFLNADRLVGSAKAEQPLDINGSWECSFEVK